ncbi:S-layer homology domain-containing protein [Peptoniphilus sp. HCN-40583]|uniref:S-layer homology domain-containing protein n=1 Tax=Peptoniphilus sp. HCN-40583 TaxID=3134662 RepID=UPI0030BADABF
MGKYNKVNQTLALALSLATLSTSFSGGVVYAETGTMGNEIVQSQGQEMEMYFHKRPEIGDTKLHINTKKLKDDNKLELGDTLRMKLIVGGETYKKNLLDPVKQEHIKEDYTSDQIMGAGGVPLIPFREFSGGDVVELYVVKGNQETKVGRVSIKGEKSLEPVVEQTKDKIMISSQMTGSLNMYIYTKKDGKWKNFLFDKKNVPNAISYDFPMEKLKSTYGANAGDEYVVVHQEKGKGKTISKKMVLKDTYDAPSVEFKERESKERESKDKMAGFTISLPDNPNLDPTPIQKKLPKLKVVKGSEEKTFTLEKTNKPQELQLVNGGVFYAVPKDTPNNTEIKFSQEGENFKPSTVVTKTYKVDMRKANQLLGKLNQYSDEEKGKFKEAITNIQSTFQKEGRTQQEVDKATNALETIILPNLGDKHGAKRQEAIKTIENLKNLNESRRAYYTGQIIHASSKEEIERLVKDAQAEDKKIEDEKNRPLNEKKVAAIKTINEKYTFLTGEHEAYKTEIIKKIQAATTIPDVETLLKEAEAKNQEAENAAKILEAKKDALAKIQGLPGLTADQLSQADNDLKAAADKEQIDEVVKKYESLSEAAMKKKDLDDAKKEYIGKLEALALLSADDKERFTKEIQEADTLDLVKEAYDGAVQFNLNKAKSAALDKIAEFKNLSESEVNSARQEIMATKALVQIEPIVERYKKRDQEKAAAKTELENARKMAIEEVKKLSDLEPDEVSKYVEQINGAGSVAEIQSIQEDAARKNAENLAEKNKAKTLEAAKIELEKLVQEAKAINLSPTSNLKEKLKNTLKDAETALQGQSLDGMNAAIKGLKQVLEEVKQDQSTPPAPTPQDPKKPTPDPGNPSKPNPSQPTPPGPSKPTPDPGNPSKPNPSKPTPDPNNPQKPNPSKPTPDPNNPQKPNPSQPTPPGPSKPTPPSPLKPKRKEEAAPRRGWYNFNFFKSAPPKEQEKHKEKAKEQSPTYVDVENHWAKEAINFSLKEKLFEDIVKGDRFEPNKAMTRAEFIAILGRFEKVNVFTANISFQDIDMGAYYGKYVNWAKGMGLVNGMDATHFAPNKTISREEMATILYRYKQMKKINFDGQAKQFKDQNKIPKWAREAVKELSKSKILNGMEDGTFQGKKQLSRAEIAQIVFNMNKLR